MRAREHSLWCRMEKEHSLGRPLWKKKWALGPLWSLQGVPKAALLIETLSLLALPEECEPSAAPAVVRAGSLT